MTGNLSKAEHIRDINRNLKQQSSPAQYVAAVLDSMEASIKCLAWFFRSRWGSNMLGMVSVQGRLVGPDDGSGPSEDETRHQQ